MKYKDNEIKAPNKQKHIYNEGMYVSIDKSTFEGLLYVSFKGVKT